MHSSKSGAKLGVTKAADMEPRYRARLRRPCGDARTADPPGRTWRGSSDNCHGGAPPTRLAWVLREYPFADSNGQNSWFASLIRSTSAAGFDTCLLCADARGIPAALSDTRLLSPHLLQLGCGLAVLGPWSSVKRLAWWTYRRSPHRLQTCLAGARRSARSSAGIDHQLGRPWNRAEATWLQETLGHLDPDVVLFDSPFAVVPGTGRAARIVVAPDILSLRTASLISMGYRVRPPLDERWEIARLREADAAVAIQWEDARWIASHARVPVVAAPPTFPWRGSPSDGCQVLVVASGSLHNVDGVRWLVQKVWPEVASAVPGARLRVVGTVCSQISPSPGVDLVGEVADLRGEYTRSALVVVPLRVGSGLKVKLAEAISYGRAIVATTVGIEGLPELPDAPFLVADSAEAFASCVQRLLTDRKERRRLEGAATAVQPLFDPGQAHSGLIEIITELAETSRSRPTAPDQTPLARSRLRSQRTPDQTVVAPLSPDQQDPRQADV